jgi:hypothetical protein
MLRVAVNTLEKQSLISFLQLVSFGKRLTTQHREIKLLCNVMQGLRLGEILWNDLRDGKWTPDFDLGV